jgi:ATP-dependent Clp protease ATP-binding subunit ClpC
VSMFERYSERARRVIYFARAEALARGAAAIDTGDLVLGLTRDRPEVQSTFAQLYDRRLELRALFEAGPERIPMPAKSDIQLTDASKRSLAYADQERTLDRIFAIESHHLLRGVLREGDATAEKLTTAGFGLEAMRQASRSLPEREERVSRSPRSFWQFTSRRQKIVLGVYLALFLAAILYLHSQQ